MQVKDKETSFWKGDVTGETINGSLHVQYPGGNNETKYYSGKLTSGTLKRKEEPKEEPVVEEPVTPQVQAPVAPVAQPAVENAEQPVQNAVKSQTIGNK
jgi:hypothetical protein